MKSYILIKKEGFDPCGNALSADECVRKLLAWKGWPLWERTKNRKSVKAGDRLCIYVTGDTPNKHHVVASATIKTVVQWSLAHDRTFPIEKDAVPSVVLTLTDCHMFNLPVSVPDKLDTLSFIPENRKKWGVAFMGGIRAITSDDYDQLVETPTMQNAA